METSENLKTTNIVKLSNTKNSSVLYLELPSVYNDLENGPDYREVGYYSECVEEYKSTNSLMDSELTISPASYLELVEFGYYDPSNESRILETPDCESWMGLGYTERDNIELLDILNKNAKIIVLEVRPRYWEDTTVNLVVDGLGTLMPCISNGKWCPSIDIETGKITNWVQGKTASVHYKVCDDGTYHIFGKKGEFLYRQDSYVPEFLSIGENGYGDYIIMEIDENGYIQYWDKKIDFESFVNSAI